MRSSRGLLVAVACATLAACGGSPAQPTPPPPSTCTYTLSPDTVSVVAGGGTGTLALDTGSSCTWTVTSDGTWVHPPSSGGTGPASIVVQVDSNDATTARTTRVHVGTASAAVQQEGRSSCTCTVDPSSKTVDAGGGSSSFDVRSSGGCTWHAESSAAWVQVRSPVGDATGDGHVELGIDRNTAEQERTATVTVRDAIFTVRQRGATPTPPECSYSVSVTSIGMHWHGPGGQFDVSTGSGCTWTVTVDVPWLTLTQPSSHTGPGQVAFLAAELTKTATRSAPIMVRWPSETEGQNVWINQSGCYYAVAPSTVSAAAAGGRLRVDVLGDPMDNTCPIGCPWTARSRVSWIHILTPMPSSGDNPFSFDVDANTGAARQGTVDVGEAVLTVTQAAP